MAERSPRPTTIVFVHGWAGSAEAWTPVRRVLENDSGLSLEFLRLPGSPRRDRSGTPTIASAAAELVDRLRSAGRPAVLVGHSLGAQVTLLAHGEAPDLVDSEIVIDPAYGARAEELPRHAALAAALNRGERASLHRFFESVTEGLEQDLRAAILADVESTDLTAIARYLRSEYIDEDAIGMAPATIAAASLRRSPVLSLHSTGEGLDRESTLPAPAGSRHELWEGRSHYLHLEDAARFAGLVREWALRR